MLFGKAFIKSTLWNPTSVANAVPNDEIQLTEAFCSRYYFKKIRMVKWHADYQWAVAKTDFITNLCMRFFICFATRRYY